ERRLKDEPTSTKSAAWAMRPMIGMRYSKLPSTWVSPPVAAYTRCNETTFAPLAPVKVPTALKAAGNGTTLGVPLLFVAKTTFRDVTKLSSGVTGLIERTL